MGERRDFFWLRNLIQFMSTHMTHINWKVKQIKETNYRNRQQQSLKVRLATRRIQADQDKVKTRPTKWR